MSTSLVLLAVEFYRRPVGFSQLLHRQNELPAGVDVILHIANGDKIYTRQQQLTPFSEEELHKAALFFVESVLLAHGANHYRVLGLNQQATDEQIKKHYHLLIRLFHPDRHETQQSWKDVHAKRINQAYQVLRHPARRRVYDASLETRSVTTSLKVEGMASSMSLLYRQFAVQQMVTNSFCARLPSTRRYQYTRWVIHGTLVLIVLSVLCGLFLNYEALPTLAGWRPAPADTAHKTSALTQFIETSPSRHYQPDPINHPPTTESLNLFAQLATPTTVSEAHKTVLPTGDANLESMQTELINILKTAPPVSRSAAEAPVLITNSLTPHTPIAPFRDQ